MYVSWLLSLSSQCPSNSPCDGRGNKELRSVGVLSRVGHAKESSLGVLELEVLIREFGTVD